MEFMAHVLGQLGVIAAVILGVVALAFLVIFLFVRKKDLPESMRRGDAGPDPDEEA